MSELLRQVYASNPVDKIRYKTLELLHATFPGGAYRFVQGYSDLTATLENGQEVTFEGSGIGIVPPRRGGDERPTLGFRLDNVTLKVSTAINAALEGGGVITVYFREFISSDLSAPANNPTPLFATVAKSNRFSVTVSAGFRDVVNKSWPRRRYTTQLAPGLKYL